MDFLHLFGIYVAVVLTCIFLVCKYSGQQNNPFNTLLSYVSKVTHIHSITSLNRHWVAPHVLQTGTFSSQVVAPFTPRWLQRFSHWIFHRLFHQRSNIFIYLHIFLEGSVYAEFTYEVFGFCREMDTSLTSLSVPYVLLAIKNFFFYLCIKTDP
ncbi:hypothetical protein ILYODFUR_024420, partial [Ilyodon furcidens]